MTYRASTESELLTGLFPSSKNQVDKVARRKSKTKLFEALEKASGLFGNLRGVGVEGLKHRAITNETRGKKSFIYITMTDIPARRKMGHFLTAEGFKVHPGYEPKHTLEVEVAYFKGFGWDSEHFNFTFTWDKK